MFYSVSSFLAEERLSLEKIKAWTSVCLHLGFHYSFAVTPQVPSTDVAATGFYFVYHL
jgi:hypothetical protein